MERNLGQFTQNSASELFSGLSYGVVLIALLVSIRLLAMWFFPLTDTTEARYGEIARKMLETGDWVTLWHDYGVPFWAKPPLSTWLSAFSMKLFGVNEFAARLPAFLLTCLILAFIWQFCRSLYGRRVAYLSLIISSSMLLIYVVGGTVMTDVSLLLGCMLAFVSFWHVINEWDAINKPSYYWRLLFFFALGVNLLTKGLAALALTLLPLFFWMIWAKQWRHRWSCYSNAYLFSLFASGLLIVAVISVPWYVMAEIKTPGFLNYFIIGEHFNRFLIPAWQGDMYGNAHEEPLGMIWGFLLVDTLPWGILAIILGIYLYLKKNSVQRPVFVLDDATKYLLCWSFVPLIFFTFSSNIILTYTLTTLPPLAILLARLFEPFAYQGAKQHKPRLWLYVVALFSPALLFIALTISEPHQVLAKKSSRGIVELFNKYTHPETVQKLAYVGGRIYSMEFYTEGKNQRFDALHQALANLPSIDTQHIALTKEQVDAMTKKQKQRLEYLGATKRYQLYHVTPRNRHDS